MAKEASNGKEVICCGPDDDTQEALGLMEQHEIRRPLVTNQYGELTGILTMGDILSFTQAVRSRSKKAGNNHIDASEIMGFLKCVSGLGQPTLGTKPQMVGGNKLGKHGLKIPFCISE